MSAFLLLMAVITMAIPFFTDLSDFQQIELIVIWATFFLGHLITNIKLQAQIIIPKERDRNDTLN